MNRSLVAILDDHDEFRDSTAWLLEGMGHDVLQSDRHDVVIDALETLPMDTACALLLDIRMPAISGLEVHDKLLAQAITVPVIYMTAHGDVPLAVSAMRKGALAFLEKPLDYTQLRKALVQALGVPAQRRRIAHQERLMYAGVRENIKSLTPRETQVLDSILADQSNKQIARTFGISLKTVEMHRSRLMHKLGARSAAQLVRLVLNHEPG